MPRRTFLSRFAPLILLAVMGVSPVVFWYAVKAIRTNTNQVEDWLPKTYPETKRLVWFRQYFVADQFAVVSWEGCKLGEEVTRARTTHGSPAWPA